VDEIEALFRRYAERLWREVIWPLTRDDARAQDALCETFLAALRAWGRFRPHDVEAGAWPWLRRIAHNKALDELRRDRRDERLGARVLRFAPEPARPLDPQGEALGRERAALRAERIAAVLAAMNERYAEVLRLRLQQGLGREACAERLALKVGTFDVLLHRAVRAFREAYLARFGDDPEEEP